jgi:hypothetical protein
MGQLWDIPQRKTEAVIWGVVVYYQGAAPVAQSERAFLLECWNRNTCPYCGTRTSRIRRPRVEPPSLAHYLRAIFPV